MQPPVVQTSGVRFRFTSHTRDDAFQLAAPDLTIQPGQHTACTGPSGCGKTTLLRLITGLLTPQSGTISLAGQHIDKASDRDRRQLRLARVGMVFQDFKLLSHLSVLDNATLPARLAQAPGRSLTDARVRARTLAHSLGVEHTLRRKPDKLSQGERQRIAICRALVNNPDLLVGDEPTGNLDPERARSTIELMRREATARGATLLVVTHDHSLLDLFEHVIDLPASSVTTSVRPVSETSA